MAKTLDGKFNLNNIVKAVKQIPGVEVVDGARHKYVLKYSEACVGNCALDTSTHTDHHLVPWLRSVTGLSKDEVYNSLRKKKFYH